ncbi:MAG: hypothetical protein U1F43_21175 [Myxococcota bacterium]
MKPLNPLSLRTLRGLALVGAVATVASIGGDAAAECPAQAAVTCTRYADRLVVESSAGRLVLKGDWKKQADGTFHTGSPFHIATPGGIDFPVPGVEDVTVTCSPYLAITGTVDALPGLTSVWPDSSIAASDPTISIGMALGEQIADLDVPVEPCNPYIYFAVESSISASFGDLEMGVIEGDDVKFLLNPWDPSLLVELGGRSLGGATGGFVQRVGFGMSRHGDLHWESILDLPLGPGAQFATKAPAELDGHVWWTGKYGLLPIPSSPVQVMLDGDIVVDLGPWPAVAEHALGALASGDTADLAGIIAEHTNAGPNGIRRELAFGANANSLSLSTEFLSIDFAKASIVMDHGQLRFAAKAWTPGTGMDGHSGLPLLDMALASVVVKSQLGASGYVDKNAYHFELTGSFQVGPVAMNNAKLVIDSQDGVSMERGQVDIDVAAFVAQLKSIFHCDLLPNRTTCSAGGFPIASVEAGTTDGKVTLRVNVDIFGLSGAGFDYIQNPDGTTSFTAHMNNIPGLFGFGLSDAKLTLTPNAVAIEAGLDQIFRDQRFKGTFRRVKDRLQFTLSASGKTKIALFPGVDYTATLSNATGTTHLMVDANFVPSKYDPIFSASTLKLHGEVATDGKFVLDGEGALDVMGYKLGALKVSLSNIDGQFGFGLKGDFDAQIVHVALSGNYQYGVSQFVMTGASDFIVNGYTVTSASFGLSRERGLVGAGWLNLGVLTLWAQVAISPAGATTFTASTNLSLPIRLPVRSIIRAGYCVAGTMSNAAGCVDGFVNQTMSEFGQDLSCGMQPIRQCTEDMVQTIKETVQDAFLCGFETVGCGVQKVADGAKCGFDIAWDKLGLMGQCVNDWFQCIGAYGQQACERNPPQSCLEFATPKMCYVDFGACQPASCERVRQVTVPGTCTDIGQEIASCWHSVTVPTACTNVPAQECYPEESQVSETQVGYFSGSMSLTFGTTISASVSGTYYDTYLGYSTWSASGTVVGIGQSGRPQVCINIPQDAIPGGAILDVTGAMPQVCLPL